MEKKLDGNYIRVLRAILNKSWRQHPTKQQLYGHLPLIMKTIKIRQTRHAGHCWSRDELISDLLQWTHSHGWTKAGWPARTYIQQLCANMGCSSVDQLKAMDNREGWQEMVRDIHTDGTTWWWWILCNWEYRSVLLPRRIHNVLPPYQLGLENILTETLQRSKTSKDGPGYDTKQHLMVRLQSWSFRVCGVLLHSHWSKVSSFIVNYNRLWLNYLKYFNIKMNLNIMW